VTEHPATVQRWFEFVESKDIRALDALVADDAVFRSPAVHAPQVGKALTMAYLTAALDVLGPSVAYRASWSDATSAVLEFEATLDGTDVHGIDLLRWDGDGRIVEFTVFVRPLRGLEKLISLMGQKLTQRD
jgi:hypothetical protein